MMRIEKWLSIPSNYIARVQGVSTRSQVLSSLPTHTPSLVEGNLTAKWAREHHVWIQCKEDFFFEQSILENVCLPTRGARFRVSWKQQRIGIVECVGHGILFWLTSVTYHLVIGCSFLKAYTGSLYFGTQVLNPICLCGNLAMSQQISFDSQKVKDEDKNLYELWFVLKTNMNKESIWDLILRWLRWNFALLVWRKKYHD